MNLLVTRPEPDASLTAQELRRRGHGALVAPLLVVTFAPPPADLPVPGAIVVTSRNGVRALEGWPAAVPWRDRPAFATGAATGRALAALGFADIRVGSGDVGSLREIVLAQYRAGDGPIVYPVARNRAGRLEAELVAHGYDLRAVEAYRAEPVSGLAPNAAAALSAGSLDGILLYSRRTATTLRDLAAAAGLSEMLARPTCYVISPSVAEIAQTFADTVAVAAAPDEESVLALLPAGT